MWPPPPPPHFAVFLTGKVKHSGTRRRLVIFTGRNDPAPGTDFLTSPRTGRTLTSPPSLRVLLFSLVLTQVLNVLQTPRPCLWTYESERFSEIPNSVLTWCTPYRTEFMLKQSIIILRKRSQYFCVKSTWNFYINKDNSVQWLAIDRNTGVRFPAEHALYFKLSPDHLVVPRQIKNSWSLTSTSPHISSWHSA